MAFLRAAPSGVPKSLPFQSASTLLSLLPYPFLNHTATNSPFLSFSVTVPHQLNSATQTSTATITAVSATPTLVYPVAVGTYEVNVLNIQGRFLLSQPYTPQ